jgi:hypothetical protein
MVNKSLTVFHSNEEHFRIGGILPHVSLNQPKDLSERSIAPSPHISENPVRGSVSVKRPQNEGLGVRGISDAELRSLLTSVLG